MIDQSYRLIPLHSKSGSIRAFTKVDLNEFDFLNQWRWCLNTQGYARRRSNNKEIRLHRLIMNVLDKDIEIDHINGDILDNRKSNLRECAHNQNHQNLGLDGQNTSGYRGVCWDKNRNKWKASCTIKGHLYNLGRYDNILDAAKVAKEFRDLNMPFSNSRS